MARPKGIPSTLKGKTYEEIYGLEKAQSMKNKQKLNIQSGQIDCKCCDIKISRKWSGQKYCEICAKNKRKEQSRKSSLEYSNRIEIKEKRKIYMKEYYNQHKDDIISRVNEWQKKPEVVEKRIKREKSPERKHKRKEYRLLNSNNLKEYQKEYCRRPISKLMKNQRDKKYRGIPEIAISLRIRKLLKYVLQVYTKTGKVLNSEQYGLDFKNIVEHLKPFPEDISKYHIDHIRPLCSFKFVNDDGSTNLEEVQKAFAPENHRLLTKEENLRKISEDIKMSARRTNE